MAKLMNSKSTPSAPSNLCIFDTPPSQVAFNKGLWMTYTPTNPVETGDSYSFNIYDSAHFFQLNKTYISFKLRFTENVKTAETPSTFYYTNFIGATFFNQVKLSYNNVLVYDSNNYDYKSYIHTLLGENGDTKGGLLTAAGWHELDSPKTNRQLAANRVLDICAPLLLEPFQTERLLIPHINIQLTLYRNKDAFCLEGGAGKEGKLEISNLKLHMRAIDVVSSAAIALENRLRTTPAQYPFTESKVKIISIPEGRFELPFTTLYHDIIPRRIIIGFLANEHEITSDSLNFGHNDVSEIQLDAGGTVYPPQPLQCDFENKNYVEAFTRMYEELGCVSNKTCPKISYKEFRTGSAFFVFNTTPSDTSSAWELRKSGCTLLKVRFSKKTPAGGLNALILSEFDSFVEVDVYRNATVGSRH
ncbi:hypothetical protein B9Z55_027725 [Caenorhabditis nigoni]|uniref:PAZ domain-containing protein n=1 Tax=Caenorhabditis nigoni TaxID=1611254 RepID=A0A2G5SFG9_9PELO|nr:hypothetical protein B9Z55_027725 [Caenorhabditis nigoni]